MGGLVPGVADDKTGSGDRCFFYHSNEGNEIVGIAEIVKTVYPDPTDKEGKAVTVDVKAVEPVKQFVTLAAIKAEPKLKDFGLCASRGSPSCRSATGNGSLS